MARRTKEEARQTRERLLDAAETVFRARGVTRTSLADIANAAGVTRGAVYWHFKDKADLFQAMCDRVTMPLEALFLRAQETALECPLATLRALCVGALQRLAGDARTQAVFEVIFHKSELVDDLAGLATSCRNERCACVGRMEALIRHCADSGALPRDIDAALAAQGLNALMVGTMHEWVLDMSAYDLDAAAPQLIDSFLAGLAAAPPRGHAARRASRAAAPAIPR